eukprot:scaffold1784_cov116-Cylindrotheca_fusiformis.AAC.4
MSKYLFYFFALYDVLFLQALVNGLSAPSGKPQIEPRQFIKLVNPIDPLKQSIPVSFVRDWPTWVLDEDNTLSRIPDDNGFVRPTSVDEIWQPVDLKRPGLKLALGLHVRDGTIRHLMPAVDLSFEGGIHRNRGMCSVPRAHTWIDFTLSLDEWDNYKIILSSRADGEDDTTDWNEISSSAPGDITGAIERAVFCLSESAPNSLGEGSHVVNVILDTSGDQGCELECPRGQMRVLMVDDDDFLETQHEESGALDVIISASMAGSESEYLPDAYKPLYNDPVFRNPLYSKFKQGQKEKEKEKKRANSNQ